MTATLASRQALHVGHRLVVTVNHLVGQHDQRTGPADGRYNAGLSATPSGGADTDQTAPAPKITSIREIGSENRNR